jgi:hypothetical protein
MNRSEKVLEAFLFIVCMIVVIIFVAVAGGCTSTPSQTGERSWHAPIERGME